MKFCDATTDRICQAIRLGATYEHAAAAGNITYQTLRSWILKGEGQVTGRHAMFVEKLKRAEAEAAEKWLEYIEDAARNGDWRAAAWKLERRFFNDYGKRVRQDNVNQNIDIDMNSLTVDQLRRLAAGEDLAAVL